MMDERDIFKCRVGSHLYGTSRPDSDEDFAGVRLHSTEQLLGLQKRPGEASESVKKSEGARNTKGDVDCKFFYLPRFIELAAQGQPGQLEMLFAPGEMIIASDVEWNTLRENIDLFKSKKGIAPFVGFALAQAHRATIKGENLRLIRDIIAAIKGLNQAYLNDKIEDALVVKEDKETYTFPRKIVVKKTLADDKKTEVIEIAGRKFNTGLTVKKFLKTLENMEEKYGTRVRAAAEEKYDFKSLGHAVRLLSQAEEFLSTGRITLPRPDSEFVKSILQGDVDPEFDWLEYISSKIDHIKFNVEPKSPLPEKPNWKALNKLCIDLQKQNIR